jgi:hypothetical protein
MLPLLTILFLAFWCLQLLVGTLADKSCFLLDQREALKLFVGDLLAAKNEATEAHARVASIQDTHNALVETTRRDAEMTTLTYLKSVKASSHLRILERGREVTEARVAALEELVGRTKKEGKLLASLQGNVF